ncbi:mitochondrial 2-oxodicarboxylate carrier [Lingula anatina]|uniref:Mitochondrial 2-oxodicarboxylate carrier n=1 Tax=Lingula anatina TaxID=7574 RepID=A0A1S3ITA5_LINAN|nr:mitochondrial 2-oxodicarboxylate carrier [Lingula anatina]|eukprot:XP_013401318.1 mitochondrial 2-oxodicarboxylate carrier [Lingula anatina]
MTGRERTHGQVKLGAMEFFAGGCAGFVEVCLMHPLDLVKTRFQIQGGPEDVHRYRGIAHCFTTIYKQEGFLSFYKGILPPMCAEFPKRAIKFFMYERFKRLYGLAGDSIPNWGVLWLSGLSTGLTEAVFINPFEVVKVKLQAERNQFAQQKSAWHTFRDITAEHGYMSRSGIWKGLTATLGRHGVFNMVYFGFYHNVKEIVPSCEGPFLEFGRKFLIGLIAGSLASCINIPFDVAKSRIQGPQPVPGQIKYRTCFATMRTVYIEEGFLALYKGLLPKVLRLGPGGAIMLLVNEYVLELLKKHM